LGVTGTSMSPQAESGLGTRRARRGSTPP
jgi:hypothetical protein